MRRVVITGMGLASPLGCDLETTWQRLHIYENAISRLSDLDKFTGLHAKLGALVQDFKMPEHYTRKVIRTMGRVSILALWATEQALMQSGLLGCDEIKNGQTGVAYGSSFGSIDPIMDFYSMLRTNEVNSITSSTYIKLMPQTTGVNLSVYFKTKGRLIPSGTACTSGSLAIGYAYEAIRNGSQDIMIAGGAEEFDATQVAIFDTLYATSVKNDTPSLTPAPFDKDRDGLVVGEGAGTLILEEYEHAKARGAHILAEIVGFATNTDGTHVTQPNFETMAICLKKALQSANLDAKQIDYVNAHGTATRHGDEVETKATNLILGAKVPISSLKSYVGHTLGACGALETIWSILMMNNDWFAPTLNLKQVDSACADLDYIQHSGRSIKSSHIMTNNFAFGGINTSLILKKI